VWSARAAAHGANDGGAASAPNGSDVDALMPAAPPWCVSKLSPAAAAADPSPQAVCRLTAAAMRSPLP
jgi:hypothetical protein